MTAVGTQIVEDGMLIRDGGAFYLRRDQGGRYLLELQRTPVDLVEKRVRLVGTLVGPDLVSADGVAPVSCPLLSGPSTMKVWIKEGTTNACQEAQARRDHREVA